MAKDGLREAISDFGAIVDVKKKLVTRKEMTDEFSGKTDLRLHLGCGLDIQPGYINIDHPKAILPDEVLRINFESHWLPFEDNSVIEIKAIHLLEHITNLIPLMNEFNRVMKRNGELIIETPLAPFPEAFQDPTHVRFITEQTWGYFCSSDGLWQVYGKNYGIVGWRILMKSQSGHNLRAILRK